MNAKLFAEWFAGLSVPERIAALSRIYSRLTVNARELFVSRWTAGKERRVQEILHGLNEIHHTLANQLTAYTSDEHNASTVNTLSQSLYEIENQYTLQDFLTPAMDFARNQLAVSPLTVYPDGTVADGNTRIRILMDRGVDVDRLPRVERIPGI